MSAVPWTRNCRRENRHGSRGCCSRNDRFVDHQRPARHYLHWPKGGVSLDGTTTLCEEVGNCREVILIDSLRDSARYCDHHARRIDCFLSYFSIHIIGPGYACFGTLCGLDSVVRELSED